ncbi:MAG: hypothetical protein ACYDCI_00100 [Candidatus Limnocylindrales bacterium]
MSVSSLRSRIEAAELRIGATAGAKRNEIVVPVVLGGSSAEEKLDELEARVGALRATVGRLRSDIAIATIRLDGLARKAGS